MKEAGGWLVNGSRSETALDLPVRTAGGCGGHQLGVTAQERGFYIFFHGDEVFAAFFDFRFGDDQFQLTAGELSSFPFMFRQMTPEEKREAFRSLTGQVIWDGETARIILKGAEREYL